MVEENKGCINCGDPNIVNPKTKLCAKCESLFREREKANFNKLIQNGAGNKKTFIPTGLDPTLSKLGDDLLGLAEHFGVEKKEIGKALLKGAMTGKFDIFKETSSGKKTKFEKSVFALKELAWIPLAYIITWQLLTLLIHRFT